jgi:hypothetical protein
MIPVFSNIFPESRQLVKLSPDVEYKEQGAAWLTPCSSFA